MASTAIFVEERVVDINALVQGLPEGPGIVQENSQSDGLLKIATFLVGLRGAGQLFATAQG